MDELPSEYDDIVIGTGVQESIIAAALARNGHKVLHLDRNDFYSGEWASFHLKGILDWIKKNKSADIAPVNSNENIEVEEELRIVPCPSYHMTATNIEEEIHVKDQETVESSCGPDSSCDTSVNSNSVDSDAPHSASSLMSTVEECSVQDEEPKTSHEVNKDSSDDRTLKNESCPTQPQTSSEDQLTTTATQNVQKEWTWEEIMRSWRKFNIDLSPKLMFCRGAMVELLVSSRISRYAEFKAVTRILTNINGRVEQVPCSRADVFSSRYVSVLEKRMLMKLIEFCLDYENRQDEYKEYADKPFADFLHSRKLSATLQHFVIHSIAMTCADTPTHKALQAMKYFLSSLGRYGNTAFLWTLYGSGELPQCFCRMCAVFGGIYVLRTHIRSMVTDSENNIRGIIDSEGKILKCRNLILEYSYTIGKSNPYNASYLSRGILITDKSIKESTTQQITFLTVPPCDEKDQPVHVIEVGYAACASPPNLYIVHLTAKANNNDVSAKDDLHHTVQTFFQFASKESGPSVDNAKPKILWSVFFTQEDVTGVEDEVLRATMPGNVYVTAGAGGSIGFDHAVSQAKKIFDKLCPGEEFLPAAPDPDDLVFEDPNNEHTSQAGFEVNSATVNDETLGSRKEETRTSEENKIGTSEENEMGASKENEMGTSEENKRGTSEENEMGTSEEEVTASSVETNISEDEKMRTSEEQTVISEERKWQEK
ncbi:rab proteins geranylgeranyltransferase component A 2-like isoform X2 [Lytechinus variegatus]|uniref:rab proteins geranylgeranyltransferase component A 2-like isoform X2 n=1 Tax=Lytechinus variegatus TaxID=7654 RepID=UPI001BB13C0A|nr:rab proteins geranylgeranyltransferase component A 2-like isoform X2 [Lytechinus variegatus]